MFTKFIKKKKKKKKKQLDAIGLERVGPEVVHAVLGNTGVHEPLAEQVAHRAAYVLVAVDVQERIDGRIHVAEPPHEQRRIVRQQRRIELAQRVADNVGQPADGERRHQQAKHPCRLAIPLYAQFLVLSVLQFA